MVEIKENNFSDIIKKTITEATRSIAEEPELEVLFGDEPPSLTGKKIRLREPGNSINKEDLTILRGQADLLALKIKNHDQLIHKKYLPSTPQAQKLYNAIEEARIEAVGAIDMPGCASNLNARNIASYRNSTLNNITQKDEAPIAEAISLIIREKLTGFAPPHNTRKFVDLWRPHINDKALNELDKLKESIFDQDTFASKIPELLDAFDIASTLGEGDPSSSKNEEGESDVEGSEQENTELSDEFDPDETEMLDEEITDDLIDLDDLEGVEDEGEDSSAPDNRGEIEETKQKLNKPVSYNNKIQLLLGIRLKSISEPIIKYISHESCLFKKDIKVDDKVLEINDFDFNSKKKEIYNSFFTKVKTSKVMILRNGKKITIKPNYPKLGFPVKIKITDNIKFNSWINRKLKLN